MDSFRIGAAITFLWLTTLHAEALDSCTDHSIQYIRAPAGVGKNIQVLTADEAAPSLTKVTSPQATRWLIEVDPDYTRQGPWDTTLFIGKGSARRASLVMRITQHGNTFSANWINDQLLFVQVWWGRFASSDLILDVDAGKILYDKLARYGEPGEACD